MHPRSLLLIALLSHQASASGLPEPDHKGEKALATSVQDFSEATGSEASSEHLPHPLSEESELAHAGGPLGATEPQPTATTTTTTSTHPHEAASQGLPPDYGLAKALIREHFDHSQMRPDVYHGILDSLLASGSTSTLELVLNFDEMMRLAMEEHPLAIDSVPYLFKSRGNVRERLYEPIVNYLISGEFLEKARTAGRDDLVDVLEWELPVPLLKKAVKESNFARVSEILAWYADYFANFISDDGYPLNIDTFNLDPTFLSGCECIIGDCMNPVILDEFFKYPYFSWKVADMLYHALVYRHDEFAEYLVSKLSEENYSKPNKSLSNIRDLNPTARTYRSSLQDAFIAACRFGLPQIAAALAKYEGMDVEGGFIEAVLDGHPNILFALVRTCGTDKIPSQERLLASLQGFCSRFSSQFASTYFDYPPVPNHFASIQAFVQFLKERINLIESNIASYSGSGRSRRGRRGCRFVRRADIATDRDMKTHLEAALRAIMVVSLLRLQGPLLLAMANSYGS